VPPSSEVSSTIQGSFLKKMLETKRNKLIYKHSCKNIREVKSEAMKFKKLILSSISRSKKSFQWIQRNQMNNFNDISLFYLLD
jgi:hypothetical protein